MDSKRVTQFLSASILFISVNSYADKDINFEVIKNSSGKTTCQSPEKLKTLGDGPYTQKAIESLFANAQQCASGKQWDLLQLTSEKLTQSLPNEAWGYYYNGIASHGLQKTEKALWLFDQALKKAEKLSEQTKAYIQYEKAKALEASGQKSVAFEFFQKAAKNGVKNSDLEMYLALEQFNKGNCEQMLKQDSSVKTEDAAIGLSECLAQANKSEKSIKVLASQLKVKKSVPVYLQEARVYEIYMADPASAVKSYTHAAALDTGGDRKAWIMKKIDHLKSQYTHLVSQQTPGDR